RRHTRWPRDWSSDVCSSDLLSAAAESASIQEHKSNTDEAGILLQMIEQYLLDLGKLGASRFRKLYDQASCWIGFRKNPSDETLRESEERRVGKECRRR